MRIFDEGIWLKKLFIEVTGDEIFRLNELSKKNYRRNFNNQAAEIDEEGNDTGNGHSLHGDTEVVVVGTFALSAVLAAD